MNKIPAIVAASLLTLSGCGDSGNTSEIKFGTIQDLAWAVCDPGTFQDNGDPYDFPCEIDGQRVLLTDWSTFGSAPSDGPGQLSVNEVFGIQGPPAAIETAQKRIGG